MRNVWLIAGLVIVLGVITVGYIRLVLILSENRPIYDALPESASIVFELKNPEYALEKLNGSEFSEFLLEAPFVSLLTAHLTALDSFVRMGIADTNFNLWEKSHLLASMSVTGRDEFDYLYIFRKKKFTEEVFQQFIFTAGQQERLNKRIFRDEAIYEWNQGAKKSLNCAFINGLFIASYTPFLVEEAIVQLRDRKSILKNPGFSEVQELAGDDADVVMYFNFEKLDMYLPLLANTEMLDIFKSIGNFGEWAELDFKIKNNAFIINGYTGAGSEKQTFLSKLNSVSSSHLEITKVMPRKSALFFYYAVNDFEDYVKMHGKTFTGELENFRNWVSNEWCFALLEPLDNQYENDVFLVVKTIDPEIAIQSLAERARLFGDDLNLEEFKNYPIGQLSVESELNNLFNHQFLKISRPFYTVIDDYVIFAKDMAVIKTVLGNYEDRQTLANDPDYLDFERNLTTTSNLYFYFNTTRSVELLNRMLSNPLVTDIRKGKKNFLKFSPAALQFSFYQDIFFTNGYISFSSQAEEFSNRMWQVKLDAPPVSSPAFVLNHYTQEKEMLIQDSLHNLYLISKSGKILWKRPLNGPVMSEVYLVDFYDNTKLQYCFNTPQHIHLIDRRGENVAGYPIRLPAEATNGMLLAEYEKKNDYRIFVACNNGNVYGFYKSGKPLPGWSPQANIGIVRFPLKYIFVDGKDYLLVTNDEGTVFFFNRRGERREKTVKLDKKLTTGFQLRASDKNFQLINVDKEGTLYKVYRNGSFSSQKQELPPNFFEFIYTDLTGDGSFEMIFVDSMVVKVLDEKFKDVASLAFSQKVNQAFVVEYDGKRGIGFLSESGKKIFFMTPDMKMHPAFPLEGCTPFIASDLFETGRKVVIAGDCKGFVNAYQVK